MSDKVSKTRRIANAVNPDGSGGKFFLSTDSDAVLFGNRNNTSIKFRKLNVGRANMNGQGQVDTQVFEDTSRGVFEPLLNRPDSDLFNRFTSTNLPLNDSEMAYQAAYFQPQLKKTGFTDAILGTDSDTTTSFNGTYFFVGDDSAFPTDSSYGNSKLHGKFPLDSDSIFAGGSLNNQGLLKRKINKYFKRGNVIFGRKQGGQTINIARVSGETTPMQFGYARTAGNQYDSENTIFTSFGTLDLQGRTIFKATDVIWGFLGQDSDSDNGVVFEYQSDGNTGQRSSGMNSNGGELNLRSFFSHHQVNHKSYVNMTGTTLTGTGTFKFAPIYTSAAGVTSNKPLLSVSDIRDSDGTLLANQSGSGHDTMTIDSDGLTVGSTNVSIPSKYNFTIINAAGSTVATIKFFDPS